MSEQVELEEYQDETRYLLFKVGQELYGTPLLGIREVVEHQETKPIPNTTKCFKGVMNIRGEVVGVVDLRVRFDQVAEFSPLNALIVFNTDSGPLAALVDKVEAVVHIPEGKIERKPNVHAYIPLEFIIGVGDIGEKLVTLIDLNRTLCAEELKTVNAVAC